jgi:hypothetical protein
VHNKQCLFVFMCGRECLPEQRIGWVRVTSLMFVESAPYRSEVAIAVRAGYTLDRDGVPPVSVLHIFDNHLPGVRCFLRMHPQSINTEMIKLCGSSMNPAISISNQQQSLLFCYRN